MPKNVYIRLKMAAVAFFHNIRGEKEDEEKFPSPKSARKLEFLKAVIDVLLSKLVAG